MVAEEQQQSTNDMKVGDGGETSSSYVNFSIRMEDERNVSVSRRGSGLQSGYSSFSDARINIKKSFIHCSVPPDMQLQTAQMNQKPDKFFQLFTGMKTDIENRAPYYLSDFGKPRSFITIVNAIFFAFVVQLIPALIFAELMDTKTNGNLAVAETLLSTGIIGIIYAILSGQPLTLLGVTGPVGELFQIDLMCVLCRVIELTPYIHNPLLHTGLAILLGTSYGLAETFDSD